MTVTTGPHPDAEWVHPEPNAFARLRHRRPWVAPALTGAVVGLGTLYTSWQDPTTSGGLFPGCPLRETTGLDCPGCGGTRALYALVHGDVGTALDHNLVLTILMPLAVVAWALWMIHAVRASLARRRNAEPPRWPSGLRMPQISHRVWLGVIGFLVAFAVVRNISAVPVLDYLNSEA